MTWEQEELIRKNKTSLLKKIVCTTHFLEYLNEKNILLDFEVDTVSAKIENTKMVSEVLKIIKTKLNWFEVLIQALKETNQGQALELLGFKCDDGSEPKQAAEGQAVTTNKLPNVSSETLNASNRMDLIVGSPECEIPAIINIIEDNPVGHAFFAKWNNFARRLNLNGPEREIFSDMIKDGKDLPEVVENVIEIWLIKHSNTEPKLSVLLEAMNKCQSTQIADAIRKEFRLDNVSTN